MWSCPLGRGPAHWGVVLPTEVWSRPLGSDVVLPAEVWFLQWHN